MKMKNICKLLLFVPFVLQAQNSVKKADKFYNHYSYSRVVERLEDKKDLNTQAHRELAESYRMLGDYTKCEEQYNLVVGAADKTAEDVLAYAKVLSMNGKYPESMLQMDAYSALKQDDRRVQLFQQNKNYLLELLKDKGQFKIKHLEMNSPEQEFGATYFGKKVVFTSSRSDISPSMRKWNGNNLSFLDVFEADVDSASSELQHVKRSQAINKKYHEGPVSYNKDGTFVFYTRNNYTATSSDGITKLELFESTLKDGKWSTPSAFAFNNKEFSVGHPALSAAGDVLYFASDMPGGFGGVDLYRSIKGSDGTWSKPENLGEKINTEGNEVFPFLHESGLLFFSSDGQPGLGGLDLFVTQVRDGSLSKAENLGAPVNSSKDDFSLALNSDQTKGYFSSNRETGQGNDDIYSFDLLKPFVFGKQIKGTALDKEGQPVASTWVNLMNAKGEVVQSVVTGTDGAYTFAAEDGQNYSLKGSKEKYFDGKNTASTVGSEPVVTADVVLEKDPGYALQALVTDNATHQPLEGVKLAIRDDKGNVIEYITPANGEYLTALADKKTGDLLNYHVEISKPGYISKTVDFKKLLEKPGVVKMQENLDLSLGKIEIGADIGKLVNINPIYFDVNKFNIRPDAAIELDKIVKAMNDYPGMVIELGSHTDCRAPKAYNMNLSDKRAKASAAYVVSKGIAASRIYGKGYGESKLKNGCACEGAVKSTCSDAEHQENRRTEFIIVKLLD
jgi:outer membrane protein OmpA-like peptidoglycan-associated protein